MEVKREDCGTAGSMRIPIASSRRRCHCWFRRPLKIYLYGMALLAGLLAAAGCAQGSYPLDIFYEMHYQPSYKAHEPPRLSAPESAVPFYPAPRATSFADDGQHLFGVNCSMCHGPGAKGDGPVLQKMEGTYGYTPLVSADLTPFPPNVIENILSQTIRPFGPQSVMPPFGKLLSPEEQRLIAEYIDTLP